MAIGTAAALIGSAVIGAGATAYGASQSKKAANKALDAQTRANEQDLALQRETRDLIVGLNEPFRQGGLSAFDALMAEYGIRPTAAATGTPAPTGNTVTPTAPATPAQPQPDFNAYVQSDPGIMAEFNRNMASGKGREYLSSLGISTPADFGRWHYETYGQAEGRNLPMTQPAAPTQPTAPGPTAPTTPQAPSPANPPTDLMTAPRPNAPAAPVFARPQTQPFQDPGAAPAFSFDASRIAEDPGYKFRLDESLKAVNAASLARGKLRSGDAAAALMDRASGLASQETQNAFLRQLQGYQANTQNAQFNRNFGYNVFRDATNRSDQNFADDRAYGTARWQFDTNRADQIFNLDRNFQAGRYDTRIGNLFDLARFGTAATANVSGAANNYANSASNIYGSQANAAADAAYARAQANNQMAGGLASGAGNLFAAWGGGTRSVQPQQPWNPTFVNTPASIRF